MKLKSSASKHCRWDHYELHGGRNLAPDERLQEAFLMMSDMHKRQNNFARNYPRAPTAINMQDMKERKGREEEKGTN
jgi:hypothetical protein